MLTHNNYNTFIVSHMVNEHSQAEVTQNYVCSYTKLVLSSEIVEFCITCQSSGTFTWPQPCC